MVGPEIPVLLIGVFMRTLVLMLYLAIAILPAFGADKVTVQQLEATLAASSGKGDKELARRLADLELTERLSTPRFDQLQRSLSGEKSRAALVALADASAFLSLPASEILSDAPPDRATQGQILSRAVDFVAASVTKMPDFLARQTTTRYQDMKARNVQSEPVVVTPGIYYLLSSDAVTIRFRNGKEEEERNPGKKGQDRAAPPQGLITWGVFGPMLGVVMKDLLKAKVGWSRWEQSPSGRLAVFRYSVPQDRSSYTVRYCCLNHWQSYWQIGEGHVFEAVPQYDGEIAVEPKSGNVLRLTVKTAIGPPSPIYRADVLVEYGPVEIGGRTYICPVKSVSVTTAMDEVYRGSEGQGHESVAAEVQVQSAVDRPRVTAINDVVFDSYHVFRSEMRILQSTEGDLP
jgi:hypothetical protein